MKTEAVALSELTVDEQNARQHSEDQLKRLSRSLNEFGQRKPIVITHDNRIVAGNGTVRAAQQLGWDSISAVRVPKNWSDEKIAAFALADNRLGELSDWNPEVLLAQFEMLEPTDLEAAGFTDIDIEDFRALFEEQVPVPFADTPDPDQATTEKPTVKQDSSYEQFLERYANRAVRAVILYYPNDDYTDIVEKLTKLSEIMGTSDNAETVQKLIEDRLANG